jgi:hypothetical protein
MKAMRDNTIAMMASNARAKPAAGGQSDQICPSICPSDWDKRETPFATPYTKGGYERRFQDKRRGQDFP